MIKQSQFLLYGKEGVKHPDTNPLVLRCPKIAVKITTGTSETSFADVERGDAAASGGDADDFWNDWYIVMMTGARKGKWAKITDYANVAGYLQRQSVLVALLVLEILVTCFGLLILMIPIQSRTMNHLSVNAYEQEWHLHFLTIQPRVQSYHFKHI